MCRKIPAENLKKINLFVLIQKLLHFQRKFPRICGLQFWKPWPKKLCKSPFFAEKSKTMQNFFLLINTFLKTFLQGRRIQFWQLCRDFSAKRPKVVCWKCECRKKITVPSNKIFFLQNVLFWPLECSFGNHSNKFC